LLYWTPRPSRCVEGLIGSWTRLRLEIKHMRRTRHALDTAQEFLSKTFYPTLRVDHEGHDVGSLRSVPACRRAERVLHFETKMIQEV
jgi:hypothetical protein